jgi:alkanesulfonate monooxygenase SsuD/methylene tetrahydromethanopterin reductase-like flavin-dependent oxidoreductase (luciferase family)
VRFGIEIVPFGEYADPRPVVDLAVAAEAAGWEGLSIWDHAHFPGGVGDPWVTLTAVAAATTRLRLVTSVSPLPRYRPHLLARTLHALDLLSGGRTVLGAGLGVVEDLGPTGDETDPRVRARMTDEALTLITRMCAGGPVEHHGEYYRAEGVQVAGGGGRRPRVPVWIGGLSDPALRRAARWDGWTAYAIDENQRVTLPPERFAERVGYLTAHRVEPADGDDAHRFEVAVNGTSPAGGAGLSVEYAQAGATWWFESLFGLRGGHAELMDRVTAGPPR